MKKREEYSFGWKKRKAEAEASGGKATSNGNKIIIPKPNPVGEFRPIPPRVKPRILPPFYPSLIKEVADEVESYSVVVTHGVVVERALGIVNDDDALIYHKADNRLDGDDLRKFAITIGQAVFVKVTEDEYGRVIPGAEVVIHIGADTLKSSNYIPGEQAGIYYYKLAKVVAEGLSAKLEMVCGGSHIYHTTGLTADVILRDCPDHASEGAPPEGYPGAQLLRMSFVCGHLATVGVAELDRAYAPTKHETNVLYCS